MVNKKVVNKNKKVVCKLCNKNIDLKIDAYSHIRDYNKGKMFLEGYYHTKCYVERIKEDQSSQNKVLNKAMQMLNALGRELKLPEEKEVVVLK